MRNSQDDLHPFPPVCNKVSCIAMPDFFQHEKYDYITSKNNAIIMGF